MSCIKGTETISNPLQKSALNKKGLCDYVINIASGCLHGCTFCYVPSTPAIRTKQSQLKAKGVVNPQMEWGKYLFIREQIPEKLEKVLDRKRTWHNTPAGRGVVLLCSGTDPYQNKEIADLTRKTVKVLLKYDKRVRILTRSPLWLKDLDILVNSNVTVGMSLPYINDELGRKIEPYAPSTTERYKALIEGYKAGCRLYIAVAPTPPQIDFEKFYGYLEQVLEVNPEVIFWEPINARGTNGKRMITAGLEFTKSIMHKKSWAECFIRQWIQIEDAAEKLGCLERIHIWADKDLKSWVNSEILDYWWYRPTIEKWNNQEVFDDLITDLRPSPKVR